MTSWTRGTYGVLAVAYATFVIYGSLVPLRFHRLPPDQAVETLRSVISGPVTIDSRADVATNFLLFLPLGYLAMAALRTDRRGSLGSLATLVGTAAFGAGLTVAVEFTQVFLPGRTVALSDMLAETTGGLIGASLWLVAGRPATRWLRGLAHERERPALIQRLLLLYGLGFLVSQMLPLDLTINLADLARKYRSGAIVLVPFSAGHTSWFDAVWDYVGDIVLNAPLGAAAVLAWTETGARRRPLVAFPLAAGVVALVEFGQLFVMSRYADVTDIVTGSTGAALGVMLASTLSARPVLQQPGEYADRLTRFARLAVPVWVGVLAAYHWSPYDFSLAHEQVAEGVRRLLTIPLLSYFMGTELHAFTEMARKALLAFPLGILLGLSWPAAISSQGTRLRIVALLVAAFCILCGIEAGQVFLKSRYPDLTDAVVGEVGVAAGLWLVAVTSSQRPASGDG